MARDLTGQKFGKLTVVRRHYTPSRRATFWECNCSCGNSIVLRSAELSGHKVKSCGCYPKKSPMQTYVTMNDETKTLREWANKLNISTVGLMVRIKKGNFKLRQEGYIKYYEETDDYSDLGDAPPIDDRYWEK